MAMNIETRSEGDVTYLDLKGRLVAGDGARLETSKNDSVLTTLDLKGALIGGREAQSLFDIVEALVKAGKRTLVLSLEGVDYIDTDGLREIVRTYTMVSRAGGTLKLVKLTQRLTKIFKRPRSN
jgi:anti-anti-sigma factor